MFDKKIEFYAHKLIVQANKECHPKPIRLNIPDWFKKLPHTLHDRTVKGCMPFLDALSTGYVLSLDQDIFIDHNIKSPEGDKNSNYSQTSLKEMNDPAFMNQMNLDHNIDTHHPNQLRGSPFIEKNNNCPFLKIKNPWIIKTPPGYSCLFTPPLNNQDDRFSIISGIVDTDTYPLQINFPFTINGDKYKTLTTVLKKGTPFVQVIPFKRDNWKMSIKSFDEKISKENIEGSFKFNSLILHKYKQVFWGKKKCK